MGLLCMVGRHKWAEATNELEAGVVAGVPMIWTAYKRVCRKCGETRDDGRGPMSLDPRYECTRKQTSTIPASSFGAQSTPETPNKWQLYNGYRPMAVDK